MMEYFLIAIVAIFASALTFFSGFGLGTILTPVFLLFFPVELAIALTGVVHFLNNLFKLGLIGRYINWSIALLFGLTGIVGAFFGAKLLFALSKGGPVYPFTLLGYQLETSQLNIIISILLVFFALIELWPVLRNFRFGRNFAIPGGLISGFFGGLSGHQGALRSAFLLRFGLEKKAFIATGILIACCIDITRLGVYWDQLREVSIYEHLGIMITALLAAFTGAVAGNFLLRKITLTIVHIIVGILILIVAILLGFGLI